MVEAHDAFDERRFARAILAEKRVEGAGWDVDRYMIERREAPEPHGHVERLDADGFAGLGKRRVAYDAHFKSPFRR